MSTEEQHNSGADSTQQATDPETKEDNFLGRLWKFLKKPKTWFEIAALIVLICYTHYAGQQSRTMSDTLVQIRQQTDSARIAADAANKAAETADATFKSSKEFFRIEQRPYLVPDLPWFGVPPATPVPASVNITIKNIGKTPAIKMMSAMALIRYRPLKYRPPKPPPSVVSKFIEFLQNNFQELNHQLDIAVPHEYGDLVRKDLAPNAAFFSTTELKTPILAEEIPKFNTGELMLYYIGVTRYTDAYNTSYETQFCYIYFGSQTRVWHFCDSHNTIK